MNGGGDANNNQMGNGKKYDENGNVLYNTNKYYDEDESLGKKKRLAFLDLLITASGNGTILSDEDIREEVDTFVSSMKFPIFHAIKTFFFKMFEGHDTTSAAVSWCLFLLGSNQHIQERVLQEIDTVMVGDRERAPTMKELGEMKYLECCIKEALRLYPSVPLIARHLKEDVKIGNKFNIQEVGKVIFINFLDQYIVPAGTTALIITYMLHRCPEVYKYPERYDPDRFLPENCIGRHPYSYIPFSAGPR